MSKFILKYFMLSLMIVSILSACTDDDEIENELFNSNEFRVLKVSEGQNRLEDGENGVSAVGLVLDIVFSHSVDIAELTSNLNLSGNPSYDITFDETNSIATLIFENLDYESEYELTLPAGTYGESGEQMENDFNLSFTTRPFIIPNITLSAGNTEAEEGTSTTIMALLSQSTTEAVEVNILFGGSATEGDDFNVASKTILVPAGETSGSVTLNIIDDPITEGQELVEITIESIVNGVEESPQSISVAIVDNDVLTDLKLKGVMAIRWSTEPGGNSGKAVHLRATANIPDLSVYSIGVANNGGGTDSIEYTFPAVSVAAGEDILLAREDVALLTYFNDVAATQFEHVFQTDEMSQNGNDAIELFSGTAVIETLGDPDVDGEGQPWEYTGSWAYNYGDYWYYGGVGCAASSTTTQDSDCTYPLYLNDLQIQGVMSFEADPDNDGATDRERAIHLRANRDIADLSIYGIGISNNGGGSDGREMDLPAISVSEGDNILFIRDEDQATIATYLGNCFNRFDHTAVDGGINFNGDDGVELYRNLEVIEVYGNVQDDGSGEIWEYTGSWAFKEFGNLFNYAGANCAEFAATNATSGCPYAFCD